MSSVTDLMQAEWRKISIPEWQRILEESIAQKDESRADYARWMLKVVLQEGF